MKIGLVSDTHMQDDLKGMPPAIVATFRRQAVELILHLGDINSARVLDVLEQAAPVMAVRDFTELPSADPRMSETRRLLSVAGKNVAMAHDLSWPGPRIEAHQDLTFPDLPLVEVLRRKFEAVPDIVAFGHTHEELIDWHEGVLFVNPGSAVFPGLRHARGAPGTVAVMTIGNGDVIAEILTLGQ